MSDFLAPRDDYATIVADPPWPYGNANTGGFIRSVKKDGTLAQGVTDWTYEAMSMADLEALPVAGVAADNAHLYLWFTNAFAVEAHALARAWGFEPKTILTWVKTHQKDPSRVSMKTGYYFRGATEHVLFGVRGSLRLQPRYGLPTAYLWTRIGQHSRKPDEFFDLVEEASPGPRLEMFARRSRDGWDAWGDQVDGGQGEPCTECGHDHEDAAFVADCERHEDCTESASCGSSIVEHTQDDEFALDENGVLDLTEVLA